MKFTDTNWLVSAYIEPESDDTETVRPRGLVERFMRRQNDQLMVFKVILLEARNVFSHVTGQREPAGASGEFDSTVFIELKRPAVRLVEPARFLNQCRSGFWIFGSSHPEFHSESRLPNIKIRIVRNGDSVVAVEFKGSSHSADIEATVADDRSIMTSDTVVLISIARPPIHKSGRNRNARFPAGRSQEAGDIASRSAIDSPCDFLICLPPRLGEA